MNRPYGRTPLPIHIMHNAPRVTIITATYNYSSVLRYAIQSALQQTLQDFEYWIIGDGCTDDSEQVVASFHDPRLHWHNLPSNTGSQSIPNNMGLEFARGEYIAYLGHDDLWHPRHLEKLIAALEERSAEWGHPLVEMIGPVGSDVYQLVGAVPPNEPISAATFVTSGVIHKRSLFKKIGIWHDYRTLDIAPDRDFHVRAMKASAALAHTDFLSVYKFPSAWRKNSYRDKPSHEQAAYLERMRTEPDFIERELLAITRATMFNTYEVWQRRGEGPREVTPTSPRGAQVEEWRRFRGLTPKELTPRPWWDILRFRVRHALADATRPLRKSLTSLFDSKSR